MHSSTLTSSRPSLPVPSVSTDPVAVPGQERTRSRTAVAAVACAAVAVVAVAAGTVVVSTRGDEVRIPSSATLSWTTTDRLESAHGSGADIRSRLVAPVPNAEDDPLARMHGGAGVLRSATQVPSVSAAAAAEATRPTRPSAHRLAMLLS